MISESEGRAPGPGDRSASWGSSSERALFEAARRGSSLALGEIIEGWRQYLRLIADEELPGELRAKADASDLVQETFLEAQRDFQRFEGNTPRELRAWLRQILVNNLLNLDRRYCGTAKRELIRERPLDRSPSVSKRLPRQADASPSAHAIRKEELDLMGRMLQRLPRDYRRVLELRHREALSFREIGERMQRSPDASRVLWGRAVKRLAEEVDRHGGRE